MRRRAPRAAELIARASVVVAAGALTGCGSLAIGKQQTEGSAKARACLVCVEYEAQIKEQTESLRKNSGKNHIPDEPLQNATESGDTFTD